MYVILYCSKSSLNKDFLKIDPNVLNLFDKHVFPSRLLPFHSFMFSFLKMEYSRNKKGIFQTKGLP